MQTRNTDEQTKSKRLITPARRAQNRRAQRAYRQRRREFFAKKQGQAALKRELRPAPAPAPIDTPAKTKTLDIAIARKTASMPAMLTVDHFFPPRNLASKSKSKSNHETVRDEVLQVPVPVPPPLFTSYTLLLTACVYNASALGITIDQFISSSSGSACMSLCSPFYRPYTAMSADPTLLLATATATVSDSAIPVHLRPTLPQILFPHHTLLDLIPLPALRAKAITFAATAPSLLDAVDFKRDIVERGGIVCSSLSKSESGSASGMQLQPWDMRAWVVAPWFCRKWRVLSQSENGV